jgi:hypothetical protein
LGKTARLLGQSSAVDHACPLPALINSYFITD